MKTVKVGDICNLMTGGTPSKSHKDYFEHGTIQWLVSGDIHKGEIYDCDGRITELGLKNSNAKYLPINSVMIALNGQGKTRATVAMLRTKATCNQSLVSIYPKDDSRVMPEWIYWNLKGRYNELRRITGDSGNDRRGLNMIIIRNIELPEPPSLAEQQATINRVSTAFEKISAPEVLMRRNLDNVAALQKSILHKYLSTDIDTHTHRLGDICGFVRGPFGGSLKKEFFKSDGYAVYEQRHAIYGMDTDVRYFIDKKKFEEMKRFEVKPGTLLMSCSGTIGKVTIVPEGVKPGIINQALLMFVPKKEKIRADYLELLMESRGFQDSLRDNSGGSAIQNVASVKVLKEVEVSIPGVNDQEKTVEKIREARSKADELLAQYTKKLTKLTDLRQSLLQEAFSTTNKV